MKPLDRVRKLFGFLRLHRHELFDEAFQEELEGPAKKLLLPASTETQHYPTRQHMKLGTFVIHSPSSH